MRGDIIARIARVHAVDADQQDMLILRPPLVAVVVVRPSGEARAQGDEAYPHPVE